MTRSTGARSWLELAHQALVRSARWSPVGCRIPRDDGCLSPAFLASPQGELPSQSNVRNLPDSFLTLPPLQPLSIWKNNSVFPPLACSKPWLVASSSQQGNGSHQHVQKRAGIMVLTGSTGQRRTHGNSLERGSTSEALLRRPCWEHLHSTEPASCLPPVLPIPPGPRLARRKASHSLFQLEGISCLEQGGQ